MASCALNAKFVAILTVERKVFHHLISLSLSLINITIWKIDNI